MTEANQTKGECYGCGELFPQDELTTPEGKTVEEYCEDCLPEVVEAMIEAREYRRQVESDYMDGIRGSVR